MYSVTSLNSISFTIYFFTSLLFFCQILSFCLTFCPNNFSSLFRFYLHIFYLLLSLISLPFISFLSLSLSFPFVISFSIITFPFASIPSHVFYYLLSPFCQLFFPYLLSFPSRPILSNHLFLLLLRSPCPLAMPAIL